MRDYLEKSGGCGEEGIFMSLKKPMCENIPYFIKKYLVHGLSF